ncbi:hypothetical protein EA004_18440 [Vibrio anguillarum]|uniref:Uncharacterized protein n=1 Tax=Vibrio anguillarum TaxID=55601 RepID=A0ABR9Z8X3_VIBAN|nr:hypothetical protein [Vibrio anguillarum]MBF4246984.1 hypothetical protein [Vibrio anguillarum]MBF4374899.1 hypothetical protein [Vibrio anguillarum]
MELASLEEYDGAVNELDELTKLIGADLSRDELDRIGARTEELYAAIEEYESRKDKYMNVAKVENSDRYYLEFMGLTLGFDQVKAANGEEIDLYLDGKVIATLEADFLVAFVNNTFVIENQLVGEL